QIIGLLDAYAYRPMVWGVFVQRVRIPQGGGVPDEAQIAAGLAAAATCLSALQALMADGDHLVGAQLTLADLHAYPMLRYFSLAPEGRDLLAKHPGIERWFVAIQARASVVKTRTPYETAAAHG
ncbi:MAG: glutathione S-transferase domain-containing protein, partial [Burkholderiales bacterium]|nr:glutathione S-transferase domain-containing protein [Burkholderiales bacterium]